MKTNKPKEKNYVAPSVRVIEVEESAMICTSVGTESVYDLEGEW